MFQYVKAFGDVELYFLMLQEVLHYFQLLLK
jgi:hypothetical protein